MLEDLPHALVGLGGAFEVLAGTNLLADFLRLGLFVSVILARILESFVISDISIPARE